MGLQQAKLESLPFVTAELNYLAPTPGKPRTYAFDPPPGEPKSTALPEPHNVPIFDARLIAGNLSLDREGFALIQHRFEKEFLYIQSPHPSNGLANVAMRAVSLQKMPSRIADGLSENAEGDGVVGVCP